MIINQWWIATACRYAANPFLHLTVTAVVRLLPAWRNLRGAVWVGARRPEEAAAKQLRVSGGVPLFEERSGSLSGSAISLTPTSG